MTVIELSRLTFMQAQKAVRHGRKKWQGGCKQPTGGRQEAIGHVRRRSIPIS